MYTYTTYKEVKEHETRTLIMQVSNASVIYYYG